MDINPSPLAPRRHIVDINQLPLLNSYLHRGRASRTKCMSCLCCTLVALVSALLGSGCTAAVLLFTNLGAENCTAPELPPACPGVCTARTLDGTFSENVSTTKKVLSVTVVVSFYVEHTFFSHNGSARLKVIPKAFEPRWLPNVLKPIDCRPAFQLSDNCTVHLDAEDECLKAAYKADDIVRLAHRWNVRRNELAVTEEIDTGFFTETFAWTERVQ